MVKNSPLIALGAVVLLFTCLQFTGVLSLGRRLPISPIAPLPITVNTRSWAEFWGFLLDTPFALTLPFLYSLARWGNILGAFEVLFLLLLVTAVVAMAKPRGQWIGGNKLLHGSFWTNNPLGLEMFLLLRHPLNHLALRGPATLLITFFVAWMAPNINIRDDRFPLVNLRDMLLLGGAFSLILWQVQLLTNRFGAEYRTAGLLFLQPFSRIQLLLWRNMALGIILLLLDTLVTVLITVTFHYTRWIPWVLHGVGICLIVFTSLGNLLSLLQPYTIRVAPGAFLREPDGGLPFLYGVCGTVAGLLIALVLVSPWLGWGCAILLYPLCLGITRAIFSRYEPTIVARLEEI